MCQAPSVIGCMLGQFPTLHQLLRVPIYLLGLYTELSTMPARSFMDACGAMCYNEAAEDLRKAIRDAVLPLLLSAISQHAAPAGAPAVFTIVRTTARQHY